MGQYEFHEKKEGSREEEVSKVGETTEVNVGLEIRVPGSTDLCPRTHRTSVGHTGSHLTVNRG